MGRRFQGLWLLTSNLIILLKALRDMENSLGGRQSVIIQACPFNLGYMLGEIPLLLFSSLTKSVVGPWDRASTLTL